ncbi:small subunit ribosomal protein S28e [Enteropsectra breve]|nr:small subunit ribosomal protein S28e [Enteropsectra breve]
MAKAENAPNANAELTGDDAAFIAEVTNIYNKVGAGGDVTLVRVLLRHNNKAIVRSVEGPIRIGDLLSLRECVRESRRSR